MIIYQYQNAYRYNTDSLILCYFIKKHSKQNIKKALDIGSGSGILSLFVAREFDADMDCIDINYENVFLSSYNFYKNGFLSKQTKFYNFLLGDLGGESFTSYDFSKKIKQDISKQTLHQKYDLIISNPPFYNSNQSSKTTHQDMSKNAKFLPIQSFIKNAYKLLKPKGEFIFCYESVCFDEVICELVLNKFSIEKIQFFSTTKAKNPRLMCIKARKCIKTQNEILKNISYDDEVFMGEVYELLNFQSCDIKQSLDEIRSKRF